MKLAFLATNFFGSTQGIRMLQSSADIFGIDLRTYGFMTPHQDFISIKVTKQIPALVALAEEGFTHVLYTDGPDTFFIKGQDAIEAEYTSLGSPAWLISAQSTAYPHQGLEIPLDMRFPCTGQHMGEIQCIIDSWELLRSHYHDGIDNEQGWVLRGIADGILPWLKIDTGNRLFRSEADNWQAGDSGCLAHLNGGYHDPLTGRMDRMLPVWERAFGQAYA